MSFTDGTPVRPYFASRVPASAASFLVEDMNGVRASFTFSVTVLSTDARWFGKTHANSITTRFRTAIAAAAATAGWPDTWTVSYDTANAGYPRCTLKASATQFSIELDSADDIRVAFACGFVPLPIGSGTLIESSAVSGGYAFTGTVPPYYTWTPAGLLNDFGRTPPAAQVGFSPQSANGSSVAVQMQLGTRYGLVPYWHTMTVNEAQGVVGGLMQTYRAVSTYWWQAAGYSSVEEAIFGALDRASGWWSLAVFGTPFVVGDTGSTDLLGEYEFSDGPECPIAMSGFRTLSEPNVVILPGVGQGRRVLSLCFRWVGGVA